MTSEVKSQLNPVKATSVVLITDIICNLKAMLIDWDLSLTHYWHMGRQQIMWPRKWLQKNCPRSTNVRTVIKHIGNVWEINSPLVLSAALTTDLYVFQLTHVPVTKQHVILFTLVQYEKTESITEVLVITEISGGHLTWHQYSVATNLLASATPVALKMRVA